MSKTQTAARRRIVNPVQGDAVTFLETSAESGGERSLAELEVAPGGSVTPHYHLSYTERFMILRGRLNLVIDGEQLTLGPGEEATVPIGALHAWSNESAEPAVAHVELRPGQPGFETSLRVAYGLAADGRVLKNGMPRNPLHAALLLEWGTAGCPARTPCSNAACGSWPASRAPAASIGGCSSDTGSAWSSIAGNPRAVAR
ncbi:cupin domain-containing protein [Solirubrobacter deserti]|uniref:Cupin domain-containing protein n=1 Tax=Solirubrobacter deserti TaxID=2282478 RepID=A0ABT4RJC0_9ACTN|nr:cupin domain-containing protein [Solirubrobacter deserti]MDA0138645.1 cupin domain-containing protein [Solirubrobacter deserti]